MTISYSLSQNNRKIARRLIGPVVAYTWDILIPNATTMTQYEVLPADDVNITGGLGPNPLGISLFVNSPEDMESGLITELAGAVTFETIELEVKKGSNFYVLTTDLQVVNIRLSNGGTKPVSGSLEVGSFDTITRPDMPTTGAGGGTMGKDFVNAIIDNNNQANNQPIGSVVQKIVGPNLTP